MDAPSIYPVASLHLTPTRFVADPAISRNPRPGCQHRQPPCRPGRSRCGPRSQTTIAASCNAFPASMVAAGSPAALAVSSRNAAHHNPDSGSGLAPATPAHGCCCGCQLAAARCSRAAAVMASAAANISRSSATSWSEGGPSSPDPRRPVPVCRTVRPPWPIAPGSGRALSAVPECWQWSLAYSALPIPSQI